MIVSPSMRLLQCVLLSSVLIFGANAAKTLDIYFVDVEGGQATLIVAPSGETLLVDAGWPGRGARDVNRILAAAKAAKVKRIDTLVVTHFHTDHVGGVLPLAEKMPIGQILDHGENTEADKNARVLNEDYAKAVALSKRKTVKAGDTIPVKGLEVKVLTADGNVAPEAGSQNALCAAQKPTAIVDESENAHSIGLVAQFGKFRFIDLGDIPSKVQMKLACPADQAGKADVYLTTHHGSDDVLAASVHGIAPRVAIMNNGARKGGKAEAWKMLKTSPGIEDIWQLHYAVDNGADANVADTYIANVEENCEGKYIKVSAESTGAFTVTNARNKYSKSYPAR